MCYSIENDSTYCIPCLSFQGTSESPFVSTNFRNWKKVVGQIKNHLEQSHENEQHQMAVEMVSSFLKTKQVGANIAAKVNKHVVEQQIYTKKASC